MTGDNKDEFLAAASRQATTTTTGTFVSHPESRRQPRDLSMSIHMEEFQLAKQHNNQATTKRALPTTNKCYKQLKSTINTNCTFKQPRLKREVHRRTRSVNCITRSIQTFLLAFTIIISTKSTTTIQQSSISVPSPLYSLNDSKHTNLHFSDVDQQDIYSLEQLKAVKKGDDEAAQRQPYSNNDLAGRNHVRNSTDNSELKDNEEKINRRAEVVFGQNEGHQRRRMLQYDATNNDVQQSENGSQSRVLSSQRSEQAGAVEDNKIKINRRKRSSNISVPIKQVCGDCLAIPMVALVGRRHVNGFHIQVAPTNLHGRLTTGAQSVDVEHERIRRARNNDNNDHYNNHNNNNGQMDQIHHQEPSQTSSSASAYQQQLGSNQLLMYPNMYYDNKHYQTSNNVPAALNAGYNPHTSDDRHYYQQGTYKAMINVPQSRHPFEPVSDEKCPMVGPLTVCDQIGSYPADAILHKLDNIKQALHKSYFNVDSLFTDESAGLSDPFEMKPTLTRMSSATSTAANANVVASDLMPANNLTFNQPHAGLGSKEYHHGHSEVAEPGVGVARNQYAGVKAPLQATTRRRTGTNNFSATYSNGMKSSLGSLGTAISEKDSTVSSPLDPSFRSQVNNSNGGEVATLMPEQSDDHEIEDSAITTNEHNHQKVHQQQDTGFAKENRDKHQIQAPRQGLQTSADKLLYLVERTGLRGMSGILENLRESTEQIMENPNESAGTHKIDDTNFQGIQDEDDNAESEHNVDESGSARGYEPRLKEDSASASSVQSGHYDDDADGGEDAGGGLGKRQRRTAANSVQTHKQQQQLGMGVKGRGVSPTSRLGVTLPSRQLSSNITTATNGSGYGSVSGSHDGHGVPRTTTTTYNSENQQTSAKSDSGSPAKNNQERRRWRQLGISAKSVASLSSSLPSAVSRGGTVKGSESSTKVLTVKGLSSAGALSSNDQQLNLLSSVLASSAPTGHGNTDKLSPTTRYDSKPVVQSSNRSAAALNKPGLARVFSKTSGKKPAATAGQTTSRGYNSTSKLTTATRKVRSRRQVPISVADPSSRPSMNGEEPDPERIASSSGPSSGDDNSDQPVPQPICRSKSIYISPRAALNDKKQWKYVVNAAERDPRIKQIIRVDVCEAPFEPCSADVTLPLGFTSQCKQKYAKKKLLALDAQSGMLEVDTFFIPSCCVCQLIPDKRPSSELSSPVDENS